jgi:hypothetical protein
MGARVPINETWYKCDANLKSKLGEHNAKLLYQSSALFLLDRWVGGERRRHEAAI